MLIKETGFFCFTKHIFSFSWRAQLGWISQEHGIIFKSRKREASDLPLDASLRKFIAFLSSLPDLPPWADTRTAASPHTR